MNVRKGWIGIMSAAALAVGVFAAPPAFADHWHGHWGVGVYVGPGWWGPGWYPGWWGPGYYYPPAVVTVPSQPPVYVEQGDNGSSASAPQAYYWYHCDNPQGYYPYIRECPGGWQRVVPQPPPAPSH